MSERTATPTPVRTPTEITYHWEGDYLIPDICISDEKSKPPSLTKWCLIRKSYLKNHRPIVYTDLKLSGKLYLHCHEIEEQAKNRMEFMMKQMVERFPISEDLENTDPLAWVGHMHGLQAQVEEVIKAELIYE